MIRLRCGNFGFVFTGKQIFIDYTKVFFSKTINDFDNVVSFLEQEGYYIVDDGLEMTYIGEETD